MESATSNVLDFHRLRPIDLPVLGSQSQTLQLHQTVMERKRAAMAVSLPDDLLLEILVRVSDEPTLFRCATACKRWRHLVADPSFLRRRWPDQDYSSSMAGFLAWQRKHCYGGAGLELCFVPTPRSPLGQGLRALGSLVTAAPAAAGLFDRAVPLISRHGLLLVRLEAHDTRGRPDQSIFQPAVCNLLAGTCHMLPPLNLASAIADLDEYQYGAYAVLTGADCRPNDELSLLPNDSSFFKVVIITSAPDCYHHDLKYSLQMLSSVEARWMERTNCFGDTSEDMEDYGSFSNAVVCRGTAHWLFRCYRDSCFYLIELNTQTSHISRTKLNFQQDIFLPSDTFLTLATSGTLSVLRKQMTGSQLEIWVQVQQDDHQGVGGTNSAEWLCARTIEQEEFGVEMQGGNLWVLGEKCGTLLVKVGQHVYTTDLETKRMVEVSNWPSKPISNPQNIVPLEMDWPTIFISRLSTTF